MPALVILKRPHHQSLIKFQAIICQLQTLCPSSVVFLECRVYQQLQQHLLQSRLTREVVNLVESGTTNFLVIETMMRRNQKHHVLQPLSKTLKRRVLLSPTEQVLIFNFGSKLTFLVSSLKLSMSIISFTGSVPLVHEEAPVGHQKRCTSLKARFRPRMSELRNRRKKVSVDSRSNSSFSR